MQAYLIRTDEGYFLSQGKPACYEKPFSIKVPGYPDRQKKLYYTYGTDEQGRSCDCMPVEKPQYAEMEVGGAPKLVEFEVTKVVIE